MCVMYRMRIVYLLEGDDSTQEIKGQGANKTVSDNKTYRARIFQVCLLISYRTQTTD